MKKIISYLLCLVLLLSICAGFSGCGRDAVLKLGINPYFVPMTYKDEAGYDTGYIIDLMAEAAKRMDMKLETKKCMYPSERYQYMGTNEIDCIWDVHVQDDYDYTWSESIMDSSMVCLLPSASPVQEFRFENAALGIRDASYEAQILPCNDNLKNCELCGGNSYSEIFAELDKGNTCAVVMEKHSAQYMVGKGNGKYRLLDEDLYNFSYALGFKLGNTELCGKFNAAFEDMKADGTVKELQIKWFGRELAAQY